MARKSTVAPTDLEKLLAKVSYAERVRKEADERFGYSRAFKEYQGDYASAMPSWMAGVPMVPINEVYAYGKTFVASIYSRDPYIAVNAKGKPSVGGSKVAELGVNALWRELQLKRQVRRALLDAVWAEGWLKVGYSAEFGSSEPEDGEPGLQSSEFIRKDEVFATRVSWRNMVRDPDAVDGIHDARWVAQQLILPIEAVKGSSLYEKTADLKPNLTVQLTPDGQSRLGPAYRAEQEYVVLWEIWDRDNRRVYTVSEGHNDYLMNKEWPYDFQGYPFVLIRFNDSGDDCYAPNLIGPWEPQLWEKIKIRSMQLDHLKRFGRQAWIEKGAMTRLEEDKFTKGITGSLIKIEPGKLGPQPIQYPPIQSDMYGVENRIDLDKDNISGQPNAVRSAPQRTQSRTLGEIDRLITAFQGRQNDPQSMVEDAMGDVAYKLIGLMQQYFTAERFVRATKLDLGELVGMLKDPMGQPRFDGRGFKYSKKDIQDIEYDIEVRAGSTLPLDKQNRIEAMVSLLKLGPSIGVQPGSLTSMVIGKNLVADFDMKEVDAAYESDIKKMQAAQVVQRIGKIAENQMMQEKIDAMKQTVANGGPMPGGGGEV